MADSADTSAILKGLETLGVALKDVASTMQAGTRDTLEAMHDQAKESRDRWGKNDETLNHLINKLGKTEAANHGGRTGGTWPVLFGVAGIIFGLMAPLYMAMADTGRRMATDDVREMSDRHELSQYAVRIDRVERLEERIDDYLWRTLTDTRRDKGGM